MYICANLCGRVLTVAGCNVVVLVLQEDLDKAIKLLPRNAACWAQGERSRLCSGNRSRCCCCVHCRPRQRRGGLSGTHLVGLTSRYLRIRQTNCPWLNYEVRRYNPFGKFDDNGGEPREVRSDDYLLMAPLASGKPTLSWVTKTRANPKFQFDFRGNPHSDQENSWLVIIHGGITAACDLSSSNLRNSATVGEVKSCRKPPWFMLSRPSVLIGAIQSRAGLYSPETAGR